ncbi:MAG: thioredoxin family protein [Rickettsiales bacterium]
MRFFVIILLLILSSANLSANSNIENYAKITLLKGQYQQDRLILALKFELEEGWKIYDNSVQTLGMPTEIEVGKNKNIINYQVFYPPPLEFKEFDAYTSIGYINQVIFPIVLQTNLSEEISGEILVKFAICNNICLTFNENIAFKLQQNEFYAENIDIINQVLAAQKAYNYFYILLFALLAGFILNFMPCVLPVIFLKIYHILEQPKDQRKDIIFSSFATILGIVFAFLLLAILAIAFKLIGVSLGWGMHFQEPLFITFLAIIITIFCCNIFGLFTIKLPNLFVTKLDHATRQQENFFKHFTTGILATILATPCSAPFLGTALGFALSGSAWDILLIFMALALGFALPYFILIIRPNLLKLMPKAGIWMLKLKYLMGILLIITIFWLIYILYMQTNIIIISVFAFALLSLTLFLKFKVTIVNLLNLFFYRLLIILIVILALFLPITHKESQHQPEFKENFWLDFKQVNIAELVADKQIVFVNVTADWCITCKFNEVRLLNRPVFREYVKNNNIIAVKADYTNSDAEIKLLLNSVGRYAVPTYIIFSQQNKAGKLLGEILSLDKIIEDFDHEISQINVP